MLMFKKLLLLISIPFLNGLNFDLCVVGGTSGLGRELIYRGITEKNLKILALTSSPNKCINIPYRGNGFQEKSTEEFKSKNLVVDTYWTHITDTYDNIVFCTSGTSFSNDYSDKLMEKYLCFLPDNCETIALISAYGVGDSINNASIGIQIMNNLYLKDVYRAKNNQETKLKDLNKNVKKIIYRPNALSYGKTFFNSTTRYDLAEKILKDLDLY